MKSMTGFGNSECCSKSGIIVRIDIVSYNKKQLDIRALLTKELLAFEYLAKKIVASRVSRGAITVRFEITASKDSAEQNININKNLAAAYLRQAKHLQKKLKLPGEVNINDVLQFPGVVETINIENLLDKKTFTTALKKALDNFIEMREQEGKVLQQDIGTRMEKLAAIIEKIEPIAANLPKQQQKRLSENLKSANLAINKNDDRVLKEIVIFSDRFDVSEEITRLRSHFLQFRKLISENKPVGRALEFLIQELQREINTLGTKAAHSKISPLVLLFKTELEKVREQVQNVE